MCPNDENAVLYLVYFATMMQMKCSLLNMHVIITLDFIQTLGFVGHVDLDASE